MSGLWPPAAPGLSHRTPSAPRQRERLVFNREPVVACGGGPGGGYASREAGKESALRLSAREPVVKGPSGYSAAASSSSACKPRVRSLDIPQRGADPRSTPGRSSPVSGPSSVERDRLVLLRRGSTGPLPRSEAAATSRPEPAYEEDCSEYTDRFLAGYDRGRLLGRGACAVVWLATPTGQQHPVVAVKQVAKGTTGKKRLDAESARKEIFFGSYLFHPGGEPKLHPTRFPGIRHLTKLIDNSETKRDLWLVMEYGGTSLTKVAYEIKGEFHKGERVYRITHLPMLQSMKQHPPVLKSVLRQLLSALCVLAEHHIVHSDIKPDNVLIEQDARSGCGLRARLIDLGSAFGFDRPESPGAATPEYMPPEALETCLTRGGGGGMVGGGARLNLSVRAGCPPVAPRRPVDVAQKLQRLSQPWSFDVWSLGAVLLELCLGVPLWMSYKCRAADDQRVTTGLFAVPGRDPEKIMLKQVDALQQRGLQNVLRTSLGVPINNDGMGSGQELLAMMLAWEPMDRISPQAALEHLWLQDAVKSP